MGQLEDITIDELHELLSDVDGRNPTQRILAAIAYKQGDSKTKLADQHDVTWKTINNWLDRFAEQPIEQAPYDEHRSGRPPKLTDEQKEQLFEALDDSPEAVGYDRQAWFPPLVYHYIKETFGIEYSLRHIRRLMHEAGLSWRTARPHHADADPEKERDFQQTVQKNETN